MKLIFYTEQGEIQTLENLTEKWNKISITVINELFDLTEDKEKFENVDEFAEKMLGLDIKDFK